MQTVAALATVKSFVEERLDEVDESYDAYRCLETVHEFVARLLASEREGETGEEAAVSQAEREGARGDRRNTSTMHDPSRPGTQGL